MQIMLAKRLLTRLYRERMRFYLLEVTEARTRAAHVAEAARKLFAGSLFGPASFALSLTPTDSAIDDIRAAPDAHDTAGPDG